MHNVCERSDTEGDVKSTLGATGPSSYSVIIPLSKGEPSPSLSWWP